MARFRALPHLARTVIAGTLLLSCFALTTCGSVMTGGSEQPAPETALPTTTTEQTRPTAQPAKTAGPAGTPVPALLPERVEATVVRIVDGDTIVVLITGREYTLRYIGIDTPETVRPAYPVEWMGPEASAANKALVAGKTVYLEKDVSETDQYGRLLRYVYLADGTFVNAELVRQGYAQASTYPPDVKYQDLLLQMQREAMDAGRGLWGATPTAKPMTQPAQQPTANIVILAVDKRAEVVDIQNIGVQAQDLTGWVLVSEKGNQRCSLGGVIEAGATLRIWAMAKDAGQGGYNCGFGENIWRNSEPDPAVLYDANGAEVARK